MRTTITLDDGLAAELKRRARGEGKSVSAVIAEALRAQLAKREAPVRAAPFRLITVRGGGLRPGVGARLFAYEVPTPPGRVRRRSLRLKL